MPKNHAHPYRKTTQRLAPTHHQPTARGQYDLYPAFPLGPGKIDQGYDALVRVLVKQPVITIDGYIGVLWDNLRDELDVRLRERNISLSWRSIDEAMRPEREIDGLIEAFLGGEDPLFGTRFTGSLSDFFDQNKLQVIKPDPAADLNILYGCGARLAGWDGVLVYVDVPKNEIQYRSRAWSIHNLGASLALEPKPAYKRFYFVDWVVLNRHKADILSEIDIIVDGQNPGEPLTISGEDLRAGLEQVSRSAFRVRPWFEPGPWGGQWIGEHIPQLPGDVPNYAWSFEFIVPENGLTFESDGRLLEVSFDMLMYQDHRAVLGDFSHHFGFEFPMRFDFLDTFDGGNLSIQCHPHPDYIREHFGENFTQDETYYMLDCKPGARVYLGFQEGVDPQIFRAELERSRAENTSIDIERFVNNEEAHKHDLFLIPSGTIHGSGVDNLVLEISATPYIFTFKLYDWLRLDLEGNPRPLNIERAYKNLCFERQGRKVREELVSLPNLLESGEGWQLYHLPTHPEHFYDIHRFEFSDRVDAETHGSPHLMSLVEGECIVVESANGQRQRFNFAETFLIPAAAERYTLINEGGGQAKVVKAFLKRAWFEIESNKWLIAPPAMLPR